MPEPELCEFCDHPIPARRLKMKGANARFCRNECRDEWLNAEFAEDDGEPEPEPEGPTLQEVMNSPKYTPAEKIAFAAAWGTRKVWDAFKKERGAETTDGEPGPAAPQPDELELALILGRLRLPANATKEMVSDRRREFAKRYHPDHAGPAGEATMKKINVDVDKALELLTLLGRP